MSDQDMAETFPLKAITAEGVEAATARAEHYRLLNQPNLAQSICQDVLAVDPDNQRALITLVLAMSDEFEGGGSSPNVARSYAVKLKDEYQRSYYNGIISERQARSLMSRGMGAVFAYDHFREAMDYYEKAEQLRPEGNDDAILRWNACARTIRSASLRPRPPEAELGLE
ncbi:MAG: hypothetical protein L0Z49_14285 [Actinobacteria bacterium]|nr:hypothetical protein [Actinomycetota bacterium]